MTSVQPKAVNDAGMTFRIIDNDIVPAAQYINQAYHTLVAIIQQYGIFFLNKGRQLLLQLFVYVAVAAHHPRTHGGCQAICGGRLSVNFSHFRVIGQSKVIVETPHNHFFPAEFHAAANRALQFGERKISMRTGSVLANGAIVFLNPFENVSHSFYKYEFRMMPRIFKYRRCLILFLVPTQIPSFLEVVSLQHIWKLFRM
jgi:hypothetical protein